MNRSSHTANVDLSATAALNAANRRKLALLAAGVSEARRLKAARAGLLMRFYAWLRS